jgi:F-type H+-transporting ATPase subunit b
MNFVAPEALVFWTTIFFLIFAFLLAKFAWKPILGAVKQREESINNALAEAENARKEMQNLKADNERILHEARNEREEMLKEAREIKAKMIEDAEGEAQKKANEMVAKAQESIETEKNAAISSLKSQVASLSVEIAEKLVKEQLASKDSQTKLIDSMLKDVKLN